MPTYTGDTARVIIDYSGTEPIAQLIEWLLDGEPVIGANLTKFSIPASAAGKTLAVRLTLTNDFGTDTKVSEGMLILESDTWIPDPV